MECVFIKYNVFRSEGRITDTGDVMVIDDGVESYVCMYVCMYVALLWMYVCS